MNKFRGECKVAIGGKQRSLVFNMHAYAIASEGMKLTIDEYQKALSDHRQTRAFMWLVFAGLSTAVEIKGQDADFTYFDVSEWLVDLEQESVDKIVQAIDASGRTNLPKEDIATDKKK